VEEAKMPQNLSRYGNTSSASLLIAACESWRGGAWTTPVVFAAFGAGLHWGALLALPEPGD
jgi:3-oxoacyl-[acyl-carrier-protein] synthase-3